jgi:hypothetical protein
VQETIEIVHQQGGKMVGVIVDRSGGHRPDFGCPFEPDRDERGDFSG